MQGSTGLRSCLGVATAVLALAAALPACGLLDPGPEPCPYEHAPNNPSHAFQLPVDIVPHLRTYTVGDTVRWRLAESVEVYDRSTDRRFDLRAFPFRPVWAVWRFDDSGRVWLPLLRDSVAIDARFRPQAIGDSRAQGYRMRATVERDSFRCEVAYPLRTPGRYVTTWYDVYKAGTGGSGHDRSYAEPITFEGRCDGFAFYIHNRVASGPDHLDEFVPELKFIDEIHDGSLTDEKKQWQSEFGAGTFVIEREGYFAFEVVE